VRTVLQQLHLVEQQEAQTVAVQQEVLDAAVAVAATVETQAHAVAVTETPVDEVLRDEIAALKRYFADSLDAHGQRVLADVRSAIRDSLPQPPEPPQIKQDKPLHRPVPWLLALAASAAAAVFGTLWWQTQQQGEALRADLADTKATVTELSARLMQATAVAAGAASVAVTESGAPVVVVRVPFGEVPLAGARIEQVRNFVTALAQGGVKGTVDVRRYAGRFCLAGSGGDGYSLAEAATPYIKCDLVADASEPVLGNAVTESVAFANMLAALRKQHGAAINIEVGEGSSDAQSVPYPQIGGTPPRVPTAGEWNAAAEANNRVEIRWHPAT
jgi:hypothetical protein